MRANPGEQGRAMRLLFLVVVAFMANTKCGAEQDLPGRSADETKLDSLLDRLCSARTAGKHKQIEELLALKLKTSQQYFKRASFVMKSMENSNGVYAASVLHDFETGHDLARGHKYGDQLLTARMHHAWWCAHDRTAVANFSAQLLKKYPTEKNYLECCRLNEFAGNISLARRELEQACRLSCVNLTALGIFYAKDHNYLRSMKVLDSAVRKFPTNYNARFSRAKVLCLMNNTKDLENELSALQRMGKPTSLGFTKTQAQRLALGHQQIENSTVTYDSALSELDLSRRIERLESRGVSADLAEKIDLGQSYGIAGAPEKSIQCFSRLLKAAPEDYLLHYYLSAAYHASGDLAKARAERQMSIRFYQREAERNRHCASSSKGDSLP
ncbi:MAG: hypothetical protein K2W95_17565 [Candidatus Obscuribacterales bacterium]|nr:hypothetical protein [Candidatus Obscuribacterales bacterium]